MQRIKGLITVCKGYNLAGRILRLIHPNTSARCIVCNGSCNTRLRCIDISDTWGEISNNISFHLDCANEMCRFIETQVVNGNPQGDCRHALAMVYKGYLMCGLEAGVAAHFGTPSRCFSCNETIEGDAAFPCFVRNKEVLVLGAPLHLQCHEVFITEKERADGLRRTECARKIAMIRFLGDSRCYIADFLERLTREDIYEMMWK